MDSNYYFQPDFVFRYDSFGSLLSMQYYFIQLLPPIIELDTIESKLTSRCFISNSIGLGNYFENIYQYTDNGTSVLVNYPKISYLSNCVPDNHFGFDASNYDSLILVNQFDTKNRLLKSEYFNPNNKSVYSKQFVYTTISNEGFSYQLLRRVIETVEGIPSKETKIQYKF